MKAQLRTYLLIVGRDADDQMHRELRPYTRPLEGFNDHYEDRSNAAIKRLRDNVAREILELVTIQQDLEAEAYRRLEAL